jgi:hypothetical protein
LPRLVDASNRVLRLGRLDSDRQADIGQVGRDGIYPQKPTRVGHTLSSRLNSINSDAELRASVSRIKTTAHPARALKSRAVGLGASLAPPSGTGMSVCQENEPCSITALLPSARAITVGFPLALSGWGLPETNCLLNALSVHALTFLHRRALPPGSMLGAANLMLENSILPPICKQRLV